MKYLFALTLAGLFFSTNLAFAEDERASKIIKDAVEYWRGASSYAEASMKIHRPDWERSMAFIGWTKGQKNSLVRFTQPVKDSGNSTLVKEREMWSYSPKVNKVVKIPPSMMSQSWMGSDFSHSDLSKQDNLVDQYTHKLLDTTVEDGVKIYTIEATPLESSAVVWGKEIIKVREDLIILRREFYDQDQKLVKKLEASQITQSGKRKFARVTKMFNAENSDEWTEVVYDKIDFDILLNDNIFSLSNLQNSQR